MEVRTIAQNRALHLYFQLLADCLNDAGLDMKVVLKPSVNINWTKNNVKEYLWKPLQKALTQKDSTTKLEKKKEIDLIFEHLHRHLSEKFGAFAEFPNFPSQEEVNFYANSNRTK